MDIGITGMFGNSPRRDGAFVRSFAQTAEDVGFASLWAPEHIVFFRSYDSKYPYSEDGSVFFRPDEGIYDPIMVCQEAAAATTTLKVATSVLIATERHPLLTAKLAMTLDHFSGGRFMLGVGSGWSREEFEALGVSFPRRGKRLDEYLEAIRVAWTDEVAEYHGEFVEFEGVILNPKPLAERSIPILVGGDSRAAMRRAARLGDGWYGWWANYELEPHLEMLRAELAEHGRTDDPDFQLKLGIPVSTETPDEIAEKALEAKALGVEEFVIGAGISARSMEQDLTAWADAVISAVGSSA